MPLYVIGKEGYIFKWSVWFHIESIWDSWECHVCTIIMQLLWCARCVANIWRNALLSKVCMYVNSIEIISSLLQGKCRDLESWLQIAQWLLCRPVLLFFSLVLQRYFSTSSSLRLQSSLIGLSCYSVTLSSLQTMCIFSFSVSCLSCLPLKKLLL